jgi:hypothetical protein
VARSTFADPVGWSGSWFAATPRRIRLVAYGARLESVLGASPRGFESPILRQKHRSARNTAAPETPQRRQRRVRAQNPQPGFESPILRQKHRSAVNDGYARRTHSPGSNPPSSARNTAAPSTTGARTEPTAGVRVPHPPLRSSPRGPSRVTPHANGGFRVLQKVDGEHPSCSGRLSSRGE